MNSLCSIHGHGFRSNVVIPEPLNCVIKFNFESADLVAGKLYNYATSTYTTASIVFTFKVATKLLMIVNKKREFLRHHDIH